MCVSPITIRVRCPEKTYYDAPSYIHIYRKAVGSPVYRDIIPGAYNMVTVPCGKCVECLRRRQSDIAVRCSNEAQKRGSMCFVTLTYNPSHLPFMSTLQEIDTDTGEITLSEQKVLCSGFSCKHRLDMPDIMLHEQLRSSMPPKRKAGSKPIVRESDLDYLEGKLCSKLFTPTVCRKDLQLWLKSSRVAFERQFGHKLPEFTYLACQEYGPKTSRPHFHICFFGLPYKSVCWLAKRWSDKKCLGFGYSSVKSVKLINDDGSPGYSICAKYVSKYCAKGVFECQSVKDGIAQKPRLMASKGLGMTLTPSLIDYYRCEDLLGRVDQLSLKFKDTGEYLTIPDLKYLAEEVKKRAYWSMPGKNGRISKNALPRNYIKKIWYIYDENTQSFRASPLRKALQLFAYSDPVEDYIAKLKSDYPGISIDLLSNLVSEFEAGLQVHLLARKTSAAEYLRKQYCKSKF